MSDLSTQFCNTQSRNITLIFRESELWETLLRHRNSTLAMAVSPSGSWTIDPPNTTGSKFEKNTVQKLPKFKQCSFAEVNRYLGIEIDLLLYDAREQFDVNAFTAICGSLVGGGSLLLLLNSVIHSNIFTRESSQLSQLNQKTLQRFVKLLMESHETLTGRTTDSFTINNNNLYNNKLVNETNQFLQSQNQLISLVKRCATGHSRRPLIITANRGRGKSTALGMAVAEIFMESESMVLVTAPSKHQLEIFYKHLNQRLEQLTNSIDNSQIINKKLKFLPPDDASSLKRISGLLIVEEAGAIPTQILQKFLSNSNRMIFSTTNDGYEGNGQGFEVRFKEKLLSSFPQSKTLSLKQPARWSSNDRLEKTINDAFLLHPNKDNSDNLRKTKCEEASPSFRLVSKHELNTNESLLRSVYYLLVNAHYQTRPSDLEKILSDQSVLVFIVEKGTQLVAASLIAKEGVISSEKIQAISEKNLRFPGHLIPQSIIAHLGMERAGNLSFLRIMRIAVEKNSRRQSIATRLISFVETYAAENKVDALGTSFSLFIHVINFWFKNNFNIHRIGIRKDSSTGAHTGEFLKLVNTSNKVAAELASEVKTRFNQRVCYLASSSLRGIPTKVLLTIFVRQSGLENVVSLTKQEVKALDQELNAYLKRHRSLEMIEWSAYQLVRHKLKSSLIQEEYDRLDGDELLNLRVVFSKLIQRMDWNELIEKFQFNGQKESREKTRLAIQWLLTKF